MMSDQSETLTDRFVKQPIRLAFETEVQNINLTEAQSDLRRSFWLGIIAVIVVCAVAFGTGQFYYSVGISDDQAIFRITDAILTMIAVFVMIPPLIIGLKIGLFKRGASSVR